MKLCRFGDGEVGLVRDGDVYSVDNLAQDLLADNPPEGPGVALIHRLTDLGRILEAADLGEPVGTVEDIYLLSPVSFPTKLIAAPVNYQSHVDEGAGDPELTYGREFKHIDQLGLFLKSSSSLVGPSEGITLRFPSRRTDHEVEVAVVIGEICQNVSRAEALSCVAGYSLAIDVTLRGSEDRSFRKSIDSYSVLGPYLLTPDEIADPSAIPFSLAVNGEERQRSTTASLVKDIPSLVSWASEWFTLYPGDVIMTGTPAGVGPLRPGDVVECTMGDPLAVRMRVPVRAAPSDDESGAER